MPDQAASPGPQFLRKDTCHFQPPNSTLLKTGLLTSLDLCGLGRDLECQASARMWALMPLEGPRGCSPSPSMSREGRGGCGRHLSQGLVSPHSTVSTVTENPFSKYQTIRASSLALVFDQVHLFTGLHLGQQQGPGRVAGETADRGGRHSLSNRGKHQIHQQRLCPQADPQVSCSGELL